MGCIYLIRNTVNDKCYVGQTRFDAMKTRIPKHFSGNGSKLLKRAIDKYGEDAFTIEILHDGIIPEFLDTLEIEAIAKYNTLVPNGYNLTAGGEGGIPSEETLRKMSEVQKGRKCSAETRAKISEAHKGKKLTAETCRRISESKKGKPRKPHSEESCRRISEARKGKTLSEEACRKMSESRKGKNNHPMHDDSKTFYISLPTDIPLKEKRKRVREFSGRPCRTVYDWVRKWNSEV